MGEFATYRQLRAHGDSPQRDRRLRPNHTWNERAGSRYAGTRNKGKDGRDTPRRRSAHHRSSLPEGAKRILLDFSKVEYLNSSGIALVIQMMIAANKRGQAIQTFGLTPHFQKVFTMVGITKYTTLHKDEQTACAAFTA
jgi:anti-anti-sigma factor